MIPKEPELKKTDSRGRLILGRKYRDKYLMIVEMDEVTVIIPLSQHIEELWERIDKRLEGMDVEEGRLKDLMDKTREEVYEEIYG